MALGICNSAHCSAHSPFANFFFLLLLFCVSFKLLLVFSGCAVAETFQNLYINMLSRSFSIRDIRYKVFFVSALVGVLVVVVVSMRVPLVVVADGSRWPPDGAALDCVVCIL